MLLIGTAPQRIGGLGKFMNPEKLLSTLYLGDRACKKILIDGWNNRFCIQVNLISRIKENTNSWDYYSDEDVENGWLVFTGISFIKFVPDGCIPNDLINQIKVEKLKEKYIFDISVDSVSETGERKEVIIQVNAQEIYIEPNEKFVDNLK